MESTLVVLMSKLVYLSKLSLQNSDFFASSIAIERLVLNYSSIWNFQTFQFWNFLTIRLIEDA